VKQCENPSPFKKCYNFSSKKRGGFQKQSLIAKDLPFQNEKWFQVIFETSFVWFKWKEKQLLVFKTKMSFRICWFEITKTRCVLIWKTKAFQKILFTKLALISTRTSKVLQVTPSSFKQGFKNYSSWKFLGICKTFSSKWLLTLRTR
jgi:hypothetical protein